MKNSGILAGGLLVWLKRNISSSTPLRVVKDMDVQGKGIDLFQ